MPVSLSFPVPLDGLFTGGVTTAAETLTVFETALLLAFAESIAVALQVKLLAEE